MFGWYVLNSSTKNRGVGALRKFRVGIHYSEGDLGACKDAGVEVLQFFVGDPQKVEFIKPNGKFMELASQFEVVVHCPYWSSLFNKKIIPLHVGYIKFLNAFYASRLSQDKWLTYVMHVGSPPAGTSKDEMKFAFKSFFETLNNRRAVTRTAVFVETDSGAVGRPNFTVDELCDLASLYPFAGVCVDTEHVYAAGQGFGEIPWGRIQMVHLNAIPAYVKFGGTLDRHSHTALVDSKAEISVAIEGIKKRIKGLPVIMERRDFGLALSDARYTQEILL